MERGDIIDRLIAVKQTQESGSAFRPAREAALHALTYAFRDRRKRKSQFRSLWIARINAASRDAGVSYSRLMSAMRTAGVDVDRKVLADIAVRDAGAFAALVASAKNAIEKQQLRASLDKATAK